MDLIWGNVLFAAVLLLVTLVWGDLFRWHRFAAIGWLFLYIEEPIWMLTLVPRLQAESVEVGGDGLPIAVIAVLLVEAIVTLIVGLWFFFRRPESQGDRISSRILAGFFVGWTGWAAALAFARSWDEAIWGIALDILWAVGTVAVLLFVRPRAPAPCRLAPARADGAPHVDPFEALTVDVGGGDTAIGTRLLVSRWGTERHGACRGGREVT